ncbi:MAG TPA: RNA polymerase sigma factor [Bacteroidales bacterium]|nr:RNA polymerase sigma factor [Bacteroidales bacterium]HRS18117.1 RNA polymerase sigma factor [Bacteroidales bacterium]
MQKILYEKYASKLYALCMRYAKDRAEADDILQEGFIKIYTKIDQFSQEHSFEGWIKRIIINTAITHYNQNLKHYYQEDIDQINELEITNDEEVYEAEYSQEELLNIIHSLADGYRMVFNLYVIEGYKHKEISEILGIDIATSKSQLHRAKKIIQEKLEEIAKVKNN